MQLMVMLTGEYTEEQFLQSIRHLSALRKKHPNVGLDMITTPPGHEAAVSKPFINKGYPLCKISAGDFVNCDINRLSNYTV